MQAPLTGPKIVPSTRAERAGDPVTASPDSPSMSCSIARALPGMPALARCARGATAGTFTPLGRESGVPIVDESGQPGICLLMIQANRAGDRRLIRYDKRATRPTGMNSRRRSYPLTMILAAISGDM